LQPRHGPGPARRRDVFAAGHGGRKWVSRLKPVGFLLRSGPSDHSVTFGGRPMPQRRTSVAWTFAITSIALFMVALDNLVVTTALPVIRTDLGSSLSDLEWMVNAYTLTFAVLLLTGAALGDRFGRRRMFVIGLTIFTAGSAFAALAPSSDVLIIARAIQGV